MYENSIYMLLLIFLIDINVLLTKELIEKYMTTKLKSIKKERNICIDNQKWNILKRTIYQ